MYGTWHIRSTCKADEDKFFLDIKRGIEMPLIIQKSAKTPFRLKMGNFWPKNESEVSETVFFSDSFIS